MGYIKRNGISYFGGKQVELTQAEYDALPDTKLTDGVSYYITDANNPNVATASQVMYDNSDSGLEATNVQGAIDEVATVKSSIGNIDNVTITTSDNNKLLGVSVSSDNVSVGAVTHSSLFTSYSPVLSFSNTKTTYVDVNIDISKIIVQGAVLSADAAVPLTCSIQSLGANSTRLRVNASQNYTSYLTLYYLVIN